MLNILKTRWKIGKRTIAFPVAESALPDRFRGEPVIKAAACDEACSACVSACPTNAVMKQENSSEAGIRIDLGKCLFCGACVEACSLAGRFSQLLPFQRSLTLSSKSSPSGVIGCLNPCLDISSSKALKKILIDF